MTAATAIRMGFRISNLPGDSPLRQGRFGRCRYAAHHDGIFSVVKLKHSEMVAMPVGQAPSCCCAAESGRFLTDAPRFFVWRPKKSCRRCERIARPMQVRAAVRSSPRRTIRFVPCGFRSLKGCARPERLRGVTLARELGVSPASVTTATGELIEAGLIEEVMAPRDDGAGRGRPAQALGVRAGAHRVAGMKLSDREHTAVVVDFAGNLIADDVIPRRPGAMTVPEMLASIEHLLDRICAKAGMGRSDLSAVGIGVPGFIDGEHGTVLWSSTLTERNVALGPAAQARLGLPVVVEQRREPCCARGTLVRRRAQAGGFRRGHH